MKITNNDLKELTKDFSLDLWKYFKGLEKELMIIFEKDLSEEDLNKEINLLLGE
jgi:hypothetical protein